MPETQLTTHCQKEENTKVNKHKPMENTFIMRPHKCILIVNSKHII